MQGGKRAIIILQKDYPYSTREGSKYTLVRYFYAVDKIGSNKIELAHCPAGEVVAGCNSNNHSQGQPAPIGLRGEGMGAKEGDYPLCKEWF